MFQREREEELLICGNQYQGAIESYYEMGHAGMQAAYPNSMEDLLKDPCALKTQRHLRGGYKDPLRGEDFELIRQGDPLPDCPGPSSRSPGSGGCTESRTTQGGSMRYILATFSLFFTLCPRSLTAQEIISVIPSIVTVGTTVTVSGGPFAPDTRIVVGEREVVPSRPGEQLMVFVVPPLESGEYALMLKSDGQVSPSPFSLLVVETEPRIAAVSPGSIDECSSANERRVTVFGEAFSPGAQLLLDGAVIPVENMGETEINFIAPRLDGGLHQVQVVNPGDRKSLAFALFVNSLPEIHSVELGPDAVTHYELTVRGKNILFNSTLIVDGLSINPVLVGGGTQVFTAPAVQPGNDTVRYIDCNTMVYIRHPVSRQAKRVSMQIVNPDGQPSSLFHLTIP